jgi:hypothetical protein
MIDTNLTAMFTGKTIGRRNVVQREQPKVTPCGAQGAGDIQCILVTAHQLNHVARDKSGELVSWK